MKYWQSYMFDSFQQMNLSEPDKYNYVDLRCRNQTKYLCLSQFQRSKLRPFWSPWRVEKISGNQNSGESRVMVTILQLKVAKRRLFEKVSLER